MVFKHTNHKGLLGFGEDGGTTYNLGKELL
jgi:hypothetical protein